MHSSLVCEVFRKRLRKNLHSWQTTWLLSRVSIERISHRLEKRMPEELLNLDEERVGTMNMMDSQERKLAYNIGCTFNTTGYKRFK